MKKLMLGILFCVLWTSTAFATEVEEDTGEEEDDDGIHVVCSSGFEEVEDLGMCRDEDGETDGECEVGWEYTDLFDACFCPADHTNSSDGSCWANGPVQADCPEGYVPWASTCVPYCVYWHDRPECEARDDWWDGPNWNWPFEKIVMIRDHSLVVFDPRTWSTVVRQADWGTCMKGWIRDNGVGECQLACEVMDEVPCPSMDALWVTQPILAD